MLSQNKMELVMNEITIRTAAIEDAVGITAVHVKAWQESYKGIIAQRYLDGLSIRKRLNLRKKILINNKSDVINLVAVKDNKIIGFCDAGPIFKESDTYRGEIYAIYLLEYYKALGIGAQFMQKAKDHLVQHNLLPYIAWVLEKNTKTRKFYEKYGGQVFGQKINIIGSKEYKEIGYVF